MKKYLNCIKNCGKSIINHCSSFLQLVSDSKIVNKVVIFKSKYNFTLITVFFLFLLLIIKFFSLTNWWICILLAFLVDSIIILYRYYIKTKNQEPIFSGKKQKIIDEINEFIANPSTNHFALLLKGKWGSGKTKFIFDYSKTQENFIYVSLFGISSIEQLNSILVEKFYIHKYQLSKFQNVIYFAKKIISFLSSNNLFVKNPSDLLAIPNKCLIVFDDLERNDKIDINQLLGFINRYSEHSQHSVIIIANEDEIKEKDSYKKMKEKLVVKECLITPDFDSVFDSFTEEVVKNTELQCLIKQDILKSKIKEIFDISNFDNLRLLKSFLYELNRIINMVEIKNINNDFLLKFIATFYALYLEVKSGNMLEEDILSYKLYYMPDEEETDISKKLNNYPIYLKYSYSEYIFLLPNEFWIKILFSGEFDKSIFCHEANEFKKHQESSKDTIEVFNLIEMRDYDESYFLQNFEKLEKNLAENKYKDLCIIKHIAGVFILLIDYNLVSKDKYNIPEYFIEYIKNNQLINYSLFIDNVVEESFLNHSSHGFVYWNHDDKRFKEIENFINSQKDIKRIEFSQQEALKLQSKPDSCSNILKIINSRSGYLYILQHVDIRSFINNLAKLTSKDIYFILSKIKDQKNYIPKNNSELSEKEIQWCDNLFKEIQKRLDTDDSLSNFEKFSLSLSFKNVMKS